MIGLQEYLESEMKHGTTCIHTNKLLTCLAYLTNCELHYYLPYDHVKKKTQSKVTTVGNNDKNDSFPGKI